MNKGYLLFHSILLLFSCCVGQQLIAQSVAQARAWVQESERAIFNAHYLEQALVTNQKAQHVFKKEGLVVGVRHTQLNTITALLQQEAYLQAWQALQDLTLLPPVKDARIHGLMLTNQTWALWGLANYQEALLMADSAATHWQNLKEWEQYSYGLLLGAYAIYSDKESDFSLLEQRLTRLEQILKKQTLSNHLVARYFYQLQSSVQRQRGDIDRAIKYRLEGLFYEQQALNLSQQTRDSSRVAKSYSQLGQLYAINGALEQSISYYKKALEWYQKSQNYGALLKLSMQLGNMYHRLGDYAKAKFHFSNLKLYWAKVPDNPIWQKRNNTFVHLAKAYYYQYFEHHDSLLLYYKQQLPYLKKHQMAVGKAYQYIGQSAATLKQYDRAKEAYMRALNYTISKYGKKGSRPAQLYWILGKFYTQKKQNNIAIAYLDQAVEALFQGKNNRSQRKITPSSFTDKTLASKVYQARGKLYFEEGAYVKARQDFDQVIDLVHYLRDNYTGSQSKFSSAQQLRPIYEKAAFCAWKAHQEIPNKNLVEAIFHYAESSKASLLQEHLTKFRNQYTHVGIEVPDSLLQKEEYYLVQIARYKEQERAAKYDQNQEQARFYFDKIFALQQELQNFEKQLQQSYPYYKTREYSRTIPPSLAKVQATLQPHQVLVEYLITDAYCFIIYLSKEQAILKAVPKHQQGRFEKKLRRLRHFLSHFEHAQQDSTAYISFVKEAYWLYKYYLEHPILEGKQEILLLPDQDLHYIPFEVLLDREPLQPTNAYRDLPYLLKKYALQYHYSATLFLRTQVQINTSSGKVLGFAATYGTQNNYLSLSSALRKERSKEEVQIHNYSLPIPGTLDELFYLQQHFKGDFFFGDLANERQFKQSFSKQNYGIVHLAMHGTINYNQPAYSSLVFTENLDSLEDNLLYVYETQHLDGQQANLVVLSACKTGYGRYAEGEGIISLGRSFMHAGVPSVVMTLWELSDATSIRIMSDFYALLSAGLAKDEALRQAKLQYLKANEGTLAHPFFWASPILIGNAKSISVEQRQKPWMLWALLGSLALGTLISWRLFGH